MVTKNVIAMLLQNLGDKANNTELQNTEDDSQKV